MTRDELLEILEALQGQGSETLHVEAKLARGGLPNRLWETLSAFANSPGGGVILLGVDEEAGYAPVGVGDLHKVQADLASLCDQMEPALRPLVEPFEIDGRRILVAEVGELPPELKPCYHRGAGLVNGAFIRVADGDRKLNPYEVQALLEARGQPRHDAEPLADAAPTDLDPDLLAPLLASLRAREGAPYRDWPDERALQALHILVRDGEGRWVPSLAGWLCFARYPQERFPNLCVTFMRYPAPHPGEPGALGERYLDNVRCEGPIPQMVAETLRAAKRNMQRRGIVQGLFREDLWEYPETVLREAIVNALGHRDLSPQSRGAQAQVQMYPDRLEVLSPGGLFGPVQPDQLGEVGVQSSRNEYLMRILEDLPPPGERRPLCENRGTGLASVLEQLRRAGMTPPRFDISLTRFRLILPNHTLLDADTLAWVERITRGSPVGENQRQALAYLRHVGQMSNADYCRLTGADSRVATRELADLVERGVLQREGTRRWATYQLVDTPAWPDMTERLDRTRGAMDRKEQILRALDTSGPLSTRELARELGLTPQGVRHWLRKLRQEGRVRLTTNHPKSPDTRYAVARKDRPK